MTTVDLIDAVITHYDQTSPADVDATARRARILHWLGELSDELWGNYDWIFKREAASLAYAAGDAPVNLPTTFSHIDENGGVWLNGLQLEEVTPQVMTHMIESDYRNATLPPYAVMWQGPTGVKQIQLPYMDNAVTLAVYYSAVGPGFGAETPDEMVRYPVQYHKSVLLAGVVAKSRRAKGDHADWTQRYKMGLDYMIARELPRRAMVQRLPRAVISAW